MPTIPPPAVPALSEILKRGGPIWTLSDTGNWQVDVRTGAIFAGSVIDYIRQAQGHRPMLGHIVMGMVEKGKFGGSEVGFFERISDELIAQRRVVVE